MAASSAAAAGAPRARLRLAASSSAAAVGSSGRIVASARWRARSSGSGTISASRAWISRCAAGVRLDRAATACRGWANRIRSPSMTTRWASTAGRSSPSAGAPIASETSATVGAARAATTASARCDASGSAPIGAPTRSRSVRGIGTSPPEISDGEAMRIARPSSIANSGFPPELAWILRSVAPENGCSRRSARSRPIVSGPIGPTSIRSWARLLTARSRPNRDVGSSRRRASRKRIESPSRRRITNAMACADAGSSHWMSSTAITTWPSADRDRSVFRQATATARES